MSATDYEIEIHDAGGSSVSVIKSSDIYSNVNEFNK